MKILLLNLSAFVVSQVLLQEGDRAINWLQNHCTDPGMALPQAIDKANENTWQAIQLALAGDSWMGWLKQKLASGTMQNISNALSQLLQAQGADFHQRCLQELKTAQKQKTVDNVIDDNWQQQCAGFGRLAEPTAILTTARQVLAEDAERLKAAGYSYLAELLLMDTDDGPLFLVIFSSFLRAEITRDQELANLLNFSMLEKLSDKQDQSLEMLKEIRKEIYNLLPNRLPPKEYTKDAVKPSLSSIIDITEFNTESMKDGSLAELFRDHIIETVPEAFKIAQTAQDKYGIYAEFIYQGITQTMRWIEPGEFLMGSPKDEPERYDDEIQHKVRITQGYWLADTACTQAFWQAVMGDNPSHFKGQDNPVETVSWNDIQNFLEKLNQQNLGLKARLPTEAQWEYACRAGTTTPFWFGNNITPEQVNYDGNNSYPGGKKGRFRKQTVSVKELPCNSWGLYQMHGNVYEWCQDWYSDYPQHSLDDPVTDPEGPGSGSYRVLRGGLLEQHCPEHPVC